MAGRADNRHQVAAKAHAHDASHNSALFLKHLALVLESPAFRESHRACEFLRHVVETALKGEFDRLKERMIGIEIFHRENDYDTSTDAIVRVTANDVRKRLSQHYAEQGFTRLRIHLNSGTYIPEFLVQDAPEKDSASPVHLPAPSMESPQDTPAPASAPQPDAKSTTFAQQLQRTLRQHLGLAAMAFALVIFFLGWLGGQKFSSGFSATNFDSSRYSFYKDLLGPIANDPRVATEIVLSNPKLFLYRGSQSAEKIEDHEAQSFPISEQEAAELGVGANDIQRSFPHHHLALVTDDYTGIGEAKSLYGLANLFTTLKRPTHLSESRFLNWDTALLNHIVILGSPHLNGWTQNNIPSVDFSIEHDLIRNSHPQQGELPLYSRQWRGTELEDYGLIWMTQLSSGVRVLVLAGITSGGTAGVGGFFSDPAKMEPVYQRLKSLSKNGKIPGSWQVLLKIKAQDNIPMQADAIAYRVYGQ